MSPWVLLAFLTFASLLVNSRKLTTEENEQNSKKCGVHFLGGGNHSKHRLTKKSYGGRKFEQNEYPWTVILKLRPDPATLCSGVQISPRHILTAAHCVLAFDEIYNQLQCSLNRSYRVVSVMKNPEDISVYIAGNETDCTNPFICPCCKIIYDVAKVAVHNLDFYNQNKDLALIELSQNISETHSTPICMPIENLPLKGVLYASGLGMDRRQQWTIIPSYESDMHTLVGITSTFNHPGKEIGNMQANFTDVRAYLDWICKYSGVCPVEDSEEPPLRPL